MPSFLVALGVSSRSCLVVGGDDEALRRARRLRECGAAVTILWPELSPELLAWTRSENVSWEARRPEARDLAARPFLVVSTPRDEALSRQLFDLAGREAVLLCCVDQPEWSNYAHVAVADSGEVTVGVSSGGSAPGLAARLRDAIAEGLAGDFAGFTRRLAELRARTPRAERRASLDAALRGLRAELRVTLPDRWREG